MTDLPKRPTSALGRWRDAVVFRVANAVLRCGSPWFQAMIEGSIKYGLQAAAEAERSPQERAQALLEDLDARAAQVLAERCEHGDRR